jgi:hypothetical protein
MGRIHFDVVNEKLRLREVQTSLGSWRVAKINMELDSKHWNKRSHFAKYRCNYMKFKFY